MTIQTLGRQGNSLIPESLQLQPGFFVGCETYGVAYIKDADVCSQIPEQLILVLLCEEDMQVLQCRTLCRYMRLVSFSSDRKYSTSWRLSKKYLSPLVPEQGNPVHGTGSRA